MVEKINDGGVCFPLEVIIKDTAIKGGLDPKYKKSLDQHVTHSARAEEFMKEYRKNPVLTEADLGNWIRKHKEIPTIESGRIFYWMEDQKAKKTPAVMILLDFYSKKFHKK